MKILHATSVSTAGAPALNDSLPHGRFPLRFRPNTTKSADPHKVDDDVASLLMRCTIRPLVLQESSETQAIQYLKYILPFF